MTDAPPPAPSHDPRYICGEASTELASNRTAMAFARTRLASDRTLMSIMRTSISLIGFGFTIFQFFHTLGTKFLPGAVPSHAPRNFGFSLIVLGLVLLVFGIMAHVSFAKGLNARRAHLLEWGLVRHVDPQRVSLVTAIALGLFTLGLLAIASIMFRVGPFS